MHDEAGPQRLYGMASLSVRELAWLWAILALALLLRLPGLGWGLPPATPEVAASGLRSSYAFDEDNTLQALTRTNPAKLDFDPRLYHWGTLHLELVLAALEGAQALGVFQQPWRTAFEEMTPAEFEKVYVAGRLVSVALDMVTVYLTFLLGLEAFGKRAGLWAAAMVAVSPGHILHAAQIRVDVTAATLVVLTAILALRCIRDDNARRWLFLGVAAGLAVAAKYSSVLIVAALAAAALWPLRFAWRASRWVLLGGAAGLLLGEPFIVTNTYEVAKQAGRLIWLSRQIPEQFSIPFPVLLAQHLAGLARFSIGVPAALLAGWGFGLLIRRRSLEGILPAVAFLAGLISLIPQNFPLLRYQLPLLPFCAVAAAVALDSFGPRRRWLLGGVAVAVALAASLSQLRFMTAPHTVNLALAVVQKAVPEGQTVARIMPEVPPLDESVYPMGPNPFMDDLSKDPPPWVVTSDLPIGDYPAANQRLLETRYEQIAVFRARRILNWATLGEAGAPHDWKYTHPTLILYRLR